VTSVIYTVTDRPRHRNPEVSNTYTATTASPRVGEAKPAILSKGLE